MAATDRQSGVVIDYAFGSAGIADPSAPTVAEVNALTRIECGLADDVDAQRSGTTIDISGQCDTQDRKKAGPTNNENIEIMGWREPPPNGTDPYWTLFDDATTTTQHLVRCAAGFSGAGTPPVAAAGDIVDVYEVQVMTRSPQPAPRTEGQKFRAELAVIGYYPDITLA